MTTTQLSKEDKLRILQLNYQKDRLRHQKDFYEFFKDAWKEVDPYTELKENWHITYLAFIGEMLAKKVANRQKPRHTTVLINVPPRSLKSWLFNIALPTWAWTLNPSLPIITASYSEVLALGFSRKAQSIIKTDWFIKRYGDQVNLDQSEGGREAVGETQTSAGGVRFSTSTGGTIVGKGFLLGIIDDPLKPDEAREEKALQKNINFFNESFDTRRNDPETACAIIIMQRLAENDLSGYLIQNYENEKDFLHINLPALADGSEKVPYLKQFLKKYPQYKEEDIYRDGYLFGERFDEDFVRKQQKKGTIFFNTQFQQNPLPTDGLLFKREWFRKVTAEEFYRIERSNSARRSFVTDTAYTSNTLNDPTGILTYTVVGNTIYIINYQDDYIDSAELPQWIEGYVRRNGYDEKKSVVTIEPKGSGKVVVSLLKSLTNLNVVEYKYPKQARVSINMKKEERAEAITAMVESGRVVLVEGAWNEKFISQVVTFPLAKNDEAVDCLVMAVLRAHYIDSRYKKFALKRTNTTK